MSEPQNKPERKHRQQKHRKHHRRAMRSPCNRPPIQVTGVVGNYDKAEEGRHGRTRLRVRWTEVHEDSSGFRIRVGHYVVELEHSANGTDWFQAQRADVSAKDDGDPGTKDHHIFRKINSNLAYRFRVRAVAAGRDGCRGAWSAWNTMGTPGPEEPAAPTDVRVFTTSTNRVVCDWDAPKKAADADILDEKIQYFQVALKMGTTAAPTTIASAYKADPFAKVTKHSFRIPDADQGGTFYAWVRSVGEDSKSAWIPGTSAGNSNPAATPDGMQVGSAAGQGPAPKAPVGVVLIFDNTEDSRGGKGRCKVRWDEVTQDINSNPRDIGSYAVDFQKSDNGSSWTEDPRRVVVHAKDEDADIYAHAIFHKVIKRRYYRARVRAIAEDGKRGAWSGWTSGDQPGTVVPTQPTNVKVIERNSKKVTVDWDAPTESADSDIVDESVAYYQVQLSLSSTFATIKKFDKHVVKTQVSFKVVHADQDNPHYARVRTVSDTWGKSAWVEATFAGNSTPGASASPARPGDNARPGTLRKHTGSLPNYWYLEADGSGVSTSTYPDLFAEVGYTYGGSGATFNLPDTRRRQTPGIGSVGSHAIGQTDGDVETSRSDNHTHANDNTNGQPNDDFTNGQPSQDASGDGTGEANHQHGVANINDHNLAFNTGTGGSGQRAVSGSHSGQTGTPGNHQHQHGHGHNHGGHPHPHNHGGHPHPHQHDNRKRPRLTVRHMVKW